MSNKARDYQKMRYLFKFHLKNKTKILTILLFGLIFQSGKSQAIDQFESTEWKMKPDEVDKAIESIIQFLLSNQRKMEQSMIEETLLQSQPYQSCHLQRLVTYRFILMKMAELWPKLS